MEPNWLPPDGIRRRWHCIVLHHTASDFGSLRDIDRWHRHRGWKGCGYDFVVGNGTNSGDGQVEVGPRWIEQRDGAHTYLDRTNARRNGVSQGYYNKCGIGIVLVGNFNKTRPSQQQMESLARLVRFLMDVCHIPESQILTHGGVDQTQCPGRNFPLGQLRSMIRQRP
ncbi:MAG: hypothetical protein AMXMBFR13_07740 [Phycisphaerae bacterium]